LHWLSGPRLGRDHTSRTLGDERETMQLALPLPLKKV